jgi:hypothetical protein
MKTKTKPNAGAARAKKGKAAKVKPASRRAKVKERPASRRGANGPPPVRGVRGQDSIEVQQGLRDFLDALYNERVDDVAGDKRPFKRRLTLDEIHSRVEESDYRLSRSKIGRDRLDAEISLAAQRSIIRLARTLVEQGPDDFLLVQRATTQVLATKLLKEADEAVTLGESNAWLVHSAATLERTAARSESVRIQRDRAVSRAESRIVADLRKRLEKDDPKLLKDLLERVASAADQVREELRR